MIIPLLNSIIDLMNTNKISSVVIGSLNTDIVALRIENFPKPGEHIYGERLKIGPGGKSRNIAEMIGRLSPKNTVAMVGRTAKDPYGLWQIPLNSLDEASINTDFVNVLDQTDTFEFPGIALITVNKNGQNQIIVLSGVNADFNKSDIDASAKAFRAVAKNKGYLVLTLECPLDTAAYAVKKAVEGGLRILFDPGGSVENMDISEILSAGIYLIKPNEHEAEMLTGVKVVDFDSAKRAAEKLQKQGVENVLLTVGEKGAYLFTEGLAKHIKVPRLMGSAQKDATGCGDQTIAALCAYLQSGKSLEEAAIIAIHAGTLQFYKVGIQPITKVELNEQLGRFE